MDITEQKVSEEALRQSEERYRTILEQMDESYYETDLAGNLTFVNDATCRRLGRSRDKLIGMKYTAYTRQEDADGTFKLYNRVYRTGQPIIGYPAVAISKDGNPIFVERSIFPLRDSKGKIIGFRGISRDVTERKRADDDRKQLELKAQITSRLASVGEMAAGVAHEINNPLTGITGYAQLLMDRKDLPADIKADLAAINDGAQRVAGIVQRLLAFSRQTKPDRKLVDINDLIDSTLILRAYHLRVNNIAVDKRLAPELLETVVDPGQIQQVMLNLIVNAETEMKLAYGKGKLTITTVKRNNTIKISVKDNGPGIKSEIMDKIFDPFFTTREVGQGTGLGLSLCYGIVTEHNGRIYAESKPGKGAIFIVELPVVTDIKPPKPAAAKVIKPQKKKGASILVVDDEKVVREVISRVLTSAGHKVESSDTAMDALDKIQTKSYDVILLDIKMPGMNGVELYKRIQKIAKPLARKVIFITGDVMGIDTERFLSRTKASHIEKPFNAEQLNRAVKDALDK
jgi:PAS domain S-box-containing protein